MSSNVENKVPELSTEDKQYLADQASKVRELRQHENEAISRIGSILIEVKERVGHGHYLPWLKAEFQWTDQTARNYTNVAKLVEKHPAVLGYNIDQAPLYRLAAPSTTPEVRESILGRAATGERITKDILADAIDHPNKRKHDKKDQQPKADAKAPEQPKTTEPATQPKVDTMEALRQAILAYEAEHGPVASLTVLRNGHAIELQIVAYVVPFVGDNTESNEWVPVPPMPAAAITV